MESCSTLEPLTLESEGARPQPPSSLITSMPSLAQATECWVWERRRRTAREHGAAMSKSVGQKRPSGSKARCRSARPEAKSESAMHAPMESTVTENALNPMPKVRLVLAVYTNAWSTGWTPDRTSRERGGDNKAASAAARPRRARPRRGQRSVFSLTARTPCLRFWGPSSCASPPDPSPRRRGAAASGSPPRSSGR